MKLTPLLLIPLLFLSSCMIDWNDEKDKKITELEKQVQKLETDYVKWESSGDSKCGMQSKSGLCDKTSMKLD